MKKQLFLAMLFIASIVFAQQTITLNSITYSLDNTTTPFECSVTGYTGSSVVVNIPSSITTTINGPFGSSQLTYLVTEVGNNAFNGKNISRLTLGNNIRRIGVSAFLGNSLTEVTFTDNITQIESFAFRDNNITEIIIENTGATNIRERSFDNNPLVKVTSLSTNPATLGFGAFPNNNVIDLFIPSGTLATYTNASWVGFKSVTVTQNTTLSISDIEKNTFDIAVYPNPVQNKLYINTEEAINNIEIYSVLGHKVLESLSKTIDISKLTNGLYFVNVKDNNGKIAIKKFIKN